MTKLSRLIFCNICLFMLLLLGSCTSSKTSILEQFFTSLHIPAELDYHLNLTDTYNYESKTIQVVWESSNESVMTNQGMIHRKEVSQTVILIGTATLEGKTLKQTFIITVLGDTSMQTLEKVANSLILPQTLDTSIQLPVSKDADNQTVSIVWLSSHPEIIDSTGKVVLPQQETVVTLTAHLSLNTHSYEKKFEITVPQDAQFSPAALWHKANVFTGTIEGEIKPGKLNEFAGAVYRKCVSSRDYWSGIEVVVTLPEFIPDEKRTGISPYDASAFRYMDNPSVYLGGNSVSESDVGVSWTVGANGTTGVVDWSKSVAYRPFWRWIDSGNHFANAAWQDTCYYYYPGDTIRMSVFAPRENYLQLRIELLEETTIETYVQKRASYQLGSDYSKVFLSPEFPSKGMGLYKAEFKRVCALDQVGNEGKPTQKTNAASVNCIWHEVYLYRNINGTVYKVPMVSERYAACNAPSSFINAHQISYEGVNINLGGEVVTLSPNNNQ